MDEVFADIWAMGRWGGLLFLALATGCFSFFYYQYTYMDWYFAMFPILGVMLALAGVVLLIIGRPKRAKRPPPLAAQELIAQMGQRPMPYFVCTDCRHFASGPMCDYCFSEAYVLEIADAEDARLAAAAID